MSRNILTPLSLVSQRFTGPASYTTGGFAVRIDGLRVVEDAFIQVLGSRRHAEVASISGNVVTIRVNQFDYPAAAAGPAVEVPAGTSLTAETFIVFARGF